MNDGEKFCLTEFLLDPRLPNTPSEEHVKKWLEYKKEGSGIKDPDGTPETFEFYENLWKTIIRTNKAEYNRGTAHTNAGEVCVSGDWMCSVWSTLRWGLKLFHPEELKETGLTRRGGYPAKKSSLESGKLLENFEKFPILKDPSVCAFVYNAYTRANLIIVPAGMNGDRGRSRKIEDYWDKTMEFVLPPVIPGAPLSEYSESFEKLLNHFGVDGLFLQDWITEDPETTKHKPIPLSRTKDPTKHEGWGKDEWRALVVEMTRRIENRRKAMENRLASLQDQ